MNTPQTSVHPSLKPLPTVTTPTSPSSSPTAKPISLPQPAKVTVEIPSTSPLPVDPFDPTWIKLWEQAGPIGYLGLMCLFVWLLTRLVQTVKGK